MFPNYPSRVWLPLTCILVFASAVQVIGLEYTPRTAFTKEELIKNSFTWLASAGNRELLHVYKLSCPSCIEELKSVVEKNPKDIGPINFSTFKKEDRPLAQSLIATTLSHIEESKRAEIFGELLSIFAFSADKFHQNPKQWQSLCLNFWNYDNYDVDDPTIWADALNWMDRQNRINMLMELTKFPGSLELNDVNPIPPLQEKTYRDGFTFVALAIPWLKYPDKHPNPNQPEAANHPEELPVILINPLRQFSVIDWRKHARTGKAGAFWHFVGDPDITLHPRLLEFLAAFLDLPTDADRREAFAKAIQTIAGDQNSGPISLLAGIPRAKGLPEAAEDRKPRLMEEARKMMEDFLAYDTLRN